MAPPPHPALLDALVLAVDGEEQLAAWRSLLSQGGAEAWEQAARRRRQLDTLARFVRAQPWLAHLMLQARRLARRMHTPPAVGLEATLNLPGLGAMLGPSQEQPETVPLTWGRIEPRTLAPGTRVRLRLQTTLEPIALFFVRSGQSGPLPGGTWDLEPGEAPVLLLACTGAQGARHAEEAMGMATAVAGLVLLEAPPPDPDMPTP
ncbi:hypothetical protein ATI61_107223 [Archangium gephyra]|uniref:Uncharacterized protein n=1 Tax=Archangium gephyra TaxID=48 RepID=A0AAC8QHR5_9BACT|nr:hypothetical protein [Archangium gephyra]AKJ07774.1 Hypothetical protein AA314_09400 [Archangium gephyra]REG29527.1 hypothetical protein ATI61_107223 [Archangium gephyra]